MDPNPPPLTLLPVDQQYSLLKLAMSKTKGDIDAALVLANEMAYAMNRLRDAVIKTAKEFFPDECREDKERNTEEIGKKIISNFMGHQGG